MSILFSEDKKELIVNCRCGCENAVHIKLNDIDDDDDCFVFMTYMNGNFYRDQDDKIFRSIGRKLKKIWAIIRNKDFYYSDITMSGEDFERFKEYINSIKQEEAPSEEMPPEEIPTEETPSEEAVVEYITVKELAQKWGCDRTRVNQLLNEGRIEGAIKQGSRWTIPANAEKPSKRKRTKNEK